MTTVDDDQDGLQIPAPGLVLLFEGLVFREVAHQVKDGAVENFLPLFDAFIIEGLGQVSFAHPQGGQEQDVFAVAQILSGRQFEDLFAVDGRVELPVEVLQGLRARKSAALVRRANSR